ncbi:hypothetical protein MUP77_05015, partial [Candidatus Bathyarchaeota archaeon]|nr:hypothetical protein [Candidatus Bathyarchaeota archaeon]
FPRTAVATLTGTIYYYVELTNARIVMDVSVGGNGTASPSSLSWTSAEKKSFTITHTGSTSSKENLTFRLHFKYTGTLTTWEINNQGVLYNKYVNQIEVEGDTPLTGNIEVAPPKADPSTSLLLLLVPFLIGFILYIYRRKIRALD